MAMNTHSLKESGQSTTVFKNVVKTRVPSTETKLAKVIFIPLQSTDDDVPEDCLSIEEFEREFISGFELEKDGRAALKEGRQWVAETFYGEDGDTVRTLRLKKGMSQVALAESLGTSQSHVARIERGTENPLLGTCRRWCIALEIDMNTLDQAMQRQEAICMAKTKC